MFSYYFIFISVKWLRMKIYLTAKGNAFNFFTSKSRTHAKQNYVSRVDCVFRRTKSLSFFFYCLDMLYSETETFIVTVQ